MAQGQSACQIGPLTPRSGPYAGSGSLGPSTISTCQDQGPAPPYMPDVACRDMTYRVPHEEPLWPDDKVVGAGSDLWARN